LYRIFIDIIGKIIIKRINGEYMKIRRKIKFHLINLFRLKASAHQVALGFTLGFIPNWFPTFGLGPILSLGLAKVARVNIISAVTGGLIGSPLWPILFFLNYKSGSLLHTKTSKVDEIEEVEYLEVVETVSNFQTESTLFLTGALINIFLFSIVLYSMVYFIFKKYRARILLKLK
jgi:uncharacterized protein